MFLTSSEVSTAGTVIVCVFKSMTTLSGIFFDDENVLGTNSSSLIRSIVSWIAGSSNKSTDVKLCVTIGGGGGVGIRVDFLNLSEMMKGWSLRNRKEILKCTDLLKLSPQ